MFTEQSVGRVVVGAFVSQSVNMGLFSCRVIPQVLENDIHSAALFGSQHLNSRGSFS